MNGRTFRLCLFDTRQDTRRTIHKYLEATWCVCARHFCMTPLRRRLRFNLRLSHTSNHLKPNTCFDVALTTGSFQYHQNAADNAGVSGGKCTYPQRNSTPCRFATPRGCWHERHLSSHWAFGWPQDQHRSIERHVWYGCHSPASRATGTDNHP